MRNICIAGFLLLACLVMLSGMTSAYFSVQSDLINTFHTAETLQINLDADCIGGWKNWAPGEGNAKRVTWTIQNKSNSKVYLRAKIDGQWSTEGIRHSNEAKAMFGKTPATHPTVAGDVYHESQVSIGNKEFNVETDCFKEPTVTWTYTGSGWRQGDGDGDDYWYYSEVLNPDEQVELTFDLWLDTIIGYLGAEYKIDMTAEVIQASNGATDLIPGWDVPGY
jgi:alternate signal-mediated exported protein